MIHAIVPSPLRFSTGTVIHGSTGNTVLPNYFSNRKVEPYTLINKTIGEEFIVPQESFYKIYSIEGGLLHEYTVYKCICNIDKVFYIPISLKRYYPVEEEKCSYTYLYIKGITNVLDLLRGTRDYSIISLYQLLQMVDVDQSNVIYRNGIPFDPISISLEDPEILTDLLFDISQNGLSAPADTRLCIELSLKDCQDGVTLLNKLPDDIISCYGCSSYPYIEENVLFNRRNIGQCTLYEQIAQDQIANMKDTDLLPLDLSTECFKAFEFERIISQIYTSPYTNIVLELDEYGQIMQAYYSTLFSQDIVTRPRIQFLIPRILSDAISIYNKTHMVELSHVTLCKTWIDELYFTMYFKDGFHQCYYVNLGAYHLYTPSLIRLHSIK